MNSVGTDIKKYYSQISPKVNGLFDAIEIFLFPDGQKNIFFKTSFENVNVSQLKSFINDIVEFYGRDSSGDGKVDEFKLRNDIGEEFWLGKS